MSPTRPRKHDAKTGEAVGKHHDRLVERWRNMRRLYLAGADLRGTRRRLGISSSTIFHKDLSEPPPRPVYTRKASVLDPYVPLEKKAIDAGGAG